MKMSTVPAATMFLSLLSLAAVLPAMASDEPSTPASASKVRIVRLSEVRGDVKVDRAVDRGFENAMANLPIVEKSQVQTEMGVAEIEFEDNSSVRLGPDTLVEFPQLDRNATGATASSMRLVKGTVYVTLMKSRTDTFTLLFGDRKVDVPPASHIRLQLDGNQAKLAVLDGSLGIQGTSGQVVIPKKKTATFNAEDQSEPAVAKGVVGVDILDDWDKQNTAYHARAAAFRGNSAPYSYGLSDLGYYGSFVNAGGCGTMWRPYFVSSGWDPYSNGAWAWYGGGYTWVSPYPWGWTPYHYGSWSYCPNTGWGWVPGGSWSGLNNVTMTALRNAPATNGPATKSPAGPPVRPIAPPRPGSPTLLQVNNRPLVRSEAGSDNSFQFRRDSAGLGIPRESLGHLNKFSERAVSKGVASTPIYVTGPASQTAGRDGMRGPVMSAGAVHRGYAPPPSSAGSMPGYSASSPGMGRGAGGPVSSGSAGPRGSAPASGAPASAPAGRNH